MAVDMTYFPMRAAQVLLSSGANKGFRGNILGQQSLLILTNDSQQACPIFPKFRLKIELNMATTHPRVSVRDDQHCNTSFGVPGGNSPGMPRTESGCDGGGGS